ncbi:probable carboxylesterase 6 [Cucurbita pepo subsp. pepo]|uniref:probable carboxylesterase 6 n=1 Tax=Cucurbita pepo subsp. pepo TaxID=3664 RepID=UPI000C9D55B9|nr:probable carboxylesterase 6 [Cucurbita pepo subsp. pepo]
MPTINLGQIPSFEEHVNGSDQHDVLVEEIEGLIRVYGNGYVERAQIVPCVSNALPPELDVTSWDVVVNKLSNIWARFYIPKQCQGKLPLLVYFHGGGFCVGSAAWSCYHEFLAKVSAKAECIIMSVNYRLAPENPLPAPYEDGLKAISWLKQVALNGGKQNWWSRYCDFTRIYLGGDSAGGNIAFNVAARLGGKTTASGAVVLKPLVIRGNILIQPFFGGESRTKSEKFLVQPPRSALTMAVSDTYWRLALPSGANRDHPWCNPSAKGLFKVENLRVLPSLVCISELDILKDRNLEFCSALHREGKLINYVVHEGVGHAFQVLNKSQLSQTRTLEMIGHIKAFLCV